MKIDAYKCSDGSIVETVEEWQCKELAVLTQHNDGVGIANRLIESRDKVLEILGVEQPKKRSKRSDAGKARKTAATATT